MARHWVGASGWSYADWRGLFYPEKLKRTDRLADWAERTPGNWGQCIVFLVVRDNEKTIHCPHL